MSGEVKVEFNGLFPEDEDVRLTVPRINEMVTSITARVAANAVTSRELADGSITAEKIADSTALLVDVPDGSVTTTKLAELAVTATKIQPGAIERSKIRAGAVGSGEIEAGAIGSSHIVDGAVTRAKLGNDAVCVIEQDEYSLADYVVAVSSSWVDVYSDLKIVLGEHVAGRKVKVSFCGTAEHETASITTTEFRLVRKSNNLASDNVLGVLFARKMSQTIAYNIFGEFVDTLDLFCSNLQYRVQMKMTDEGGAQTGIVFNPGGNVLRLTGVVLHSDS